jgi:methionyl-tRNA formyltransferase
MKLVFFGTSSFGVPIIDRLQQNHEIVSVITTPDAPVGRKQELRPSSIGQWAAEQALPVLKPESLKNQSELVAELTALKADVFIIVAYGKIIPAEYISLPPLKTINVHPSLLPLYRGPSPIQYAIRNGETKTGISIMLIDEQVDHGPLLGQHEVLISPTETYLQLESRLGQISADFLAEILPNYAAGKIIPTEQNHDLATFTKMIKKEDGLIDWHNTASEIFNQYRAFTPRPGIWTHFRKQTFKILGCDVAESPVNAAAGTVLPDGLVAAGDGTALRLLTVQLEGKKAIPLKDFLNGQASFVGSQLN